MNPDVLRHLWFKVSSIVVGLKILAGLGNYHYTNLRLCYQKINSGIEEYQPFKFLPYDTIGNHPVIAETAVGEHSVNWRFPQRLIHVVRVTRLRKPVYMVLYPPLTTVTP